MSSSIVSVDASNSEDVIVDLQSVHECDDFDNVASDVCGSLDVPVLKEEAGRDVLKKEMLVDESLKACRDLADRKLNGYNWMDGILIHSIVDIDNSVVDRIVLPVVRRCHAMSLAHDKSAHVGVRGMQRLLGKRFTWPGLHADITSSIRSCDKCLRYNSAGNKKAKMVERGIVTVPFETVAVDLVGPLPTGRRGVKYLFTYICLASRWPEAQPMRTASAKEAAQCFLDIIACTGIPLKVLSDRGSVFLSKLMRGLCETLGIDSIATSPYRPQSNRVVERFHGSLKPMLAKAVDSGVDWADFLPLALFAMRQVPNRFTGFSPHQLVFGRDVD